MATTTTGLVEHAEELFIGGSWPAPIDGRLIEVISPSTEEPVSRVAVGGPKDVDAAVSSARRAFDDSPWPHLPVATRARYLTALGAAIAVRCERLATIVSAEIGTPIGRAEARTGQADGARSILDSFAALAGSYPWTTHRSGPTAELEIRRVLVGVVGAIVPWNLALRKVAPALLAGCTVILKPPEEAPLSSLMIGGAALEVGLPEGVLSIVTADRKTSGLLVRHPDVDKISFTGSSRAGKQVAASCGEQLKRVSLELGGKSAAIILPDADLDALMPGLVLTTMLNDGQVCFNQTRVLARRGSVRSRRRGSDLCLRGHAGSAIRSTSAPTSVHWSARRSVIASRVTSGSASRRAPESRPEGRVQRDWIGVSTSSPPCSTRSTTRCASLRRRSSVPSWWSSLTTENSRRFRSRTTPPTDCPGRCGRPTRSTAKLLHVRSAAAASESTV